MEEKDRYTVEKMRETIECLSGIFEVVRLVDPSETAILRLEEDGSISRQPYTCYQVWSKGARCRNCTSMAAKLSGCQRTKYEFIMDDVFYVVSRPVTLDLRDGEAMPVVLEIVSHVSDQLMLEKLGSGKSLPEQLEDLQDRLYKDELTQAFNRRYLNEFTFLHRQFDFLPRRLGIVMLDLRSFKAVNDTLGHLAGDKLLAQVAHTLASRVRAHDSVVRIGGDEFIVTLPDCDEPVILRKIEDFRAALKDIAPADFGYAYTDRFEPDRQLLMNLLDIADHRMYEEKRRSHGEAPEEALSGK